MRQGHKGLSLGRTKKTYREGGRGERGIERRKEEQEGSLCEEGRRRHHHLHIPFWIFHSFLLIFFPFTLDLCRRVVAFSGRCDFGGNAVTYYW